MELYKRRLLSVCQWCASTEKAMRKNYERKVALLMSRLQSSLPHINPLKLSIISERWEWVCDVLLVIKRCKCMSDASIASLLMSLQCPLYPVILNSNLHHIFTLMIDKGAILKKPSCEINVSMLLHQTIWNSIVANNDVQIVDYLLKAGVDPNQKDGWGATPLHLATKHRRYGLELVTSLLYYKADVNALDAKGRTPLFYALRDNPNQQVALLLLGAGCLLKPASPCLDPKRHLHQDRSLRDAAIHLVDCEINLNEIDNHGNTMLHYILSQGHFYLSKLLINRGARLNCPNKDGVTPLRCLIYHLMKPTQFTNRAEILQILELCFEKGGDVHEIDTFGRSLLMESIFYDALAKVIIEEIARLHFSFEVVEKRELSRSRLFYRYPVLEHHRNVHLIQMKSELFAHYEKCLGELKGLCREEFCEGITIFTLFEASLEKLCRYLGNAKIREALGKWMMCCECKSSECTNPKCSRNKYPIYSRYVRLRAQLAQVRRSSRQEASKILEEALEYRLPHRLIMNHIIPKLSNDEVWKLVKGKIHWFT